MAKKPYLKITKPDKTVHLVPPANKHHYDHLNKIEKDASKRLKLELVELTDEEVEKMPFKDESHVTASEAVQKNTELQAEIERLKAQLAAQQTANQASAAAPKANAAEVIALIEAAQTVEQVEALVMDDERKTVKDAAAKKIAALN